MDIYCDKYVTLEDISLETKVSVAALYNYLSIRGELDKLHSIDNDGEENMSILRESEIFEDLIRVFSMRHTKTKDVISLIKQNREIREEGWEGDIWRTNIAKQYMEPKKPESREENKYKNITNNSLPKKLKDARKKVRGTGISVKMDKMGRLLYYRIPGEWIKHGKVAKILKGE